MQKNILQITQPCRRADIEITIWITRYYQGLQNIFYFNHS